MNIFRTVYGDNYLFAGYEAFALSGPGVICLCVFVFVACLACCIFDEQVLEYLGLQ